jgi:hypothetical protein
MPRFVKGFLRRPGVLVTLCHLLVPALAALALAAGPPADIGSAARALAPAGAHVLLAQERGASFGVVAWEQAGRPTAVALRWRDGRWGRASPGPVRIRPTVIDATRKRVYLEVRCTLGTGTGDAALWLDGRRVDPLAYGDTLYVIDRAPPGRHVMVAFASSGGSATARAWTFRVR